MNEIKAFVLAALEVFSQLGVTPEQAFMKYGSILSAWRGIRVMKIVCHTYPPMRTI